MNDLTSLDIEADRLADKFDDPGLANRLDAAIDRALVERRIVGGVVLVARGGEVIFRRAAGFADREAGIPMREDAIFLLASLTKPIVTAAIMRLVEQHRIELRSEEHTSELQSLMRISYAVFCLKTKTTTDQRSIYLRSLTTHTHIYLYN